MHKARPCPPDEFLWSIAVARLVLPDDVHLQAPPNLSDDLAPLLAAGIDDWGGVSPVTIDHVNPERPWPALDRLRAATEAAGKVLAPRLTIYPEFVQRSRDAGSIPRCAPPVLVASDSEGLARDTDVVARPRRPDTPDAARRAPLPPARAGGAVGEVLDGVRRGRRGRRRRDRHAARRARSRGRGGRRGRRPAATRDRRRRGHVRPEPQHQLHERVHVQVPVLRVLEGPAVAEPARQAVSPRARGDAAPRRRSGRVRRDRGVPPGRDPSRLRRRLLRRGRPGGEGGRARHPRARVHRARGHRRRPPARHAARASTCAPARPPASRRCPAPRPRSSTTRSGRSSAPTR